MRETIFAFSIFSFGFLSGVGIMCKVYQEIRKHNMPVIKSKRRKRR